MKIVKVASFEVLQSGRPDMPLCRLVGYATFSPDNWRAIRVRELIATEKLKLEPLDELNVDLKEFGFTHMTEWDPMRGDFYAVEVHEDA